MRTLPLTEPTVDRRERALRDLRLSVTDRCNFRCGYCMPRDHFDKEHRFLPRAEILSFEEITRAVSALTAFGLSKVRLTGGEPLLRSELSKLVGMLREIDDIELALTTNGSLLSRHASALFEAGLKRLTVSLDALDDHVFRRMVDADYSVTDVLGGLEVAERAGFDRIKINCVVRRGMNEDQVLKLARHFRGSGHIVRFIEYMDVGLANGWERKEVVSGREIVDAIGAEFPLEAVPSGYQGEVARRFRYRDGRGEIGIITSVTQPFCGDCTRLRLAADGKLYTCLFAPVGHDLRAVLRSNAAPAAITSFVRGIWQAREDRYSELRSERTRGLPRPEMNYVGG